MYEKNIYSHYLYMMNPNFISKWPLWISIIDAIYFMFFSLSLSYNYLTTFRDLITFIIIWNTL